MKTAIKLMSKLKEIGIDSVIAGGYPRDIKHGVEPKDIDIIAVEGSPENMVEFYNYLAVNSLFLQAPSVVAHTNEYDSSRITCVIKIKTSGLPIDIVFWNALEYEDLEEVISFGFDYNLNQYALAENVIPLFLGSNEGSLMRVRKEDIPRKRRFKMVEKAKQVGWSIPLAISFDNILMRMRSV